MGLVSIGHSFGGQVLFRVVSSAIEKELIEATHRYRTLRAARPRCESLFKDLAI